MANDDHQFIWSLESGSRWDTVDDNDANYHDLCGYSHSPGSLNCPMMHYSEGE
jgi:hypothetical protein